MPRDMFPQSDGAFVQWVTQYTELLVTSPTTYGIDAAQAEALGIKVDAFTAALATATNRVTRSPANLEIKFAKRDELVSEVRRLTAIIQASPVMDNAKRAALGIPLRGENPPTPVPAPTAEPLIIVGDVRGNRIDVQVVDKADPNRRARPEHVATVTVLYFVGETPPNRPEGWVIQGTTSKMKTIVEVAPDTAPGSKVWMIAYYSNRKGQSGVPSEAVAAFTQYREGGLQRMKLAA